MSRDLTPTMETALAAREVRPVIIGRLDIDGDPIFSWTGPGIFAPTGTGDSALDGQTFDPIAPFVQMSSVSEDQGIGGPVTLTTTAHSDDEPILRQIVRDRRAWRGKPAYLWLGLLDEQEASVLNNPVRIKTGVITSMVIAREADNSVVDVVIDTDLGNARSAPFRYIDHRRYFPDDIFSSFLINQVNRPGGPFRPGTGNQGAGPVNFWDSDPNRGIGHLLRP